MNSKRASSAELGGICPDGTVGTTGIRDCAGVHAPGDFAVSSRLKLPTAYTGLGVSHQTGKWHFAAQGLIGVTVKPRSKETYRLEQASWTEKLGGELYLGLHGQVAYAIAEQWHLTLSAQYDRFETMKGSALVRDNNLADGDDSGFFGGDVVGASLDTLNVSAGMRYDF